MGKIKIEPSWFEKLEQEFEKPYFDDIKQFILNEQNKGKITLPPNNLIFNAFDTTPFADVKVVILGQDPYHGVGQAHGLSFSVPDDVKLPPSLKNIFKELASDINGYKIPHHGNLEQWAKQGVLLLNAILTVNKSEPASHRKAGWEYFTDAVIKTISQEKENVVFLLWGKFAQNKAHLIDENKHLVFKAPHPSPFSAYSGFFGCKHFSQTNTFLKAKYNVAIDWKS